MSGDALKHRMVMIETQTAAMASVIACLVDDLSPTGKARVLHKVDEAFERLHVFLLAGEDADSEVALRSIENLRSIMFGKH